MNGLVLGSEGFVGSALCRYLTIKDLGETRHYDIKRSAAEDLRYATLDLEGVDVVYFLAWDVGGSKYIYNAKTQADQFEWNMRLMTNVFPQLRGTRFVFISSQLAGQPTAYGMTKAMGEAWTRLLGGTILRLWNVYGTMEEMSERSHIISDLIWKAKNEGKIELRTTGDELRQFVHMQDVCRAIHHVMLLDMHGTFDVTSYKWFSIKQVAEMVGKEFDVPVVPNEGRAPKFDTPYTKKLVGWSADIPFRDGLAKMIEAAK